MAYNPLKAAQIIARFIQRTESTSINVLKAVKLVYLADRESIARYGFPILDETRVSMPHGPVNSTTYSHINGEHDLAACGWSAVLEDKEHHQIALADPAITVDDLDELSDADLECIDAVWDQFGHMNQWDLRDWTHDPKNVPEWEDPTGGSNPIPLIRIMTALGMENATDLAEVVTDHRKVDRLFESVRVH
ncbi:SocA family protein [Agrobacterium tumefaciens]|uniref:Panacea domain-containing protein n=1 Tax=Agrobacterium tumefaciens TaxID=358 RepID=UPI0021D18AB0|nr:Panacea domain-containing protein [Agrobacterium tumefaciens]UXT64144.1 SocA family protein [Agrobacterium tumefaciens]